MGDWYGGWKNRIPIVVDNTKINDDLAHFPVSIMFDNVHNFSASYAGRDQDQTGLWEFTLATNVTMLAGEYQTTFEVYDNDYDGTEIALRFEGPETIDVGARVLGDGSWSFQSTLDFKIHLSGNYTIKARQLMGTSLHWSMRNIQINGKPSVIDATIDDFFNTVSLGQKNFVITDSQSNPLYCEHMLDKLYGQFRRFHVYASSPSLVLSSTAPTTLYLYFDKHRTAPEQYVADIGSRPEVWNSGYEVVYHMVRENDTTIIKDSTSKGADLTITNATISNPEPGVDKYSAYLDSKSRDIYAVSNSMDFSSLESSHTMEMMHYTRGLINWSRFMGIGTGQTGTVLFSAGTVGTKYNVGCWGDPNHDSALNLDWNKVKRASLRYDMGQFNLFINGAQDSTINNGAVPIEDLSNCPVWLFNDPVNSTNSNTNYSTNGYLSNVKISNVARTDAWLLASYNNDINNLVDISPVESGEFHFSGTVTVQGVPTDGAELLLFKREDNSLLSTTTTFSGGLYDFYTTYEGDHYMVVFPPSGTNYNAKIYSDLITTSSG